MQNLTLDELKKQLEEKKATIEAEVAEKVEYLKTQKELSLLSDEKYVNNLAYERTFKELQKIWQTMLEASNGELVERRFYGFNAHADMLLSIIRTIHYADSENRHLAELFNLSPYITEKALQVCDRLPYYSPKLNEIVVKGKLDESEVKVELEEIAQILGVGPVDLKSLTQDYLDMRWENAYRLAEAKREETIAQQKMISELM
jgi:hypothetical protein